MKRKYKHVPVDMKEIKIGDLVKIIGISSKSIYYNDTERFVGKVFKVISTDEHKEQGKFTRIGDKRTGKTEVLIFGLKMKKLSDKEALAHVI